VDERAENPMTPAVMAAFLRTGRMTDHASSAILIGVLVLAGGTGAGIAPAALGAALVVALTEKYFAWRVALDAELFAVLAQHDDMAAFDHALETCAGRKPASPPRSLASRWSGARRLLFCQIACFGLQAAGLAAMLFL
jgi:hypothetical protein